MKCAGCPHNSESDRTLFGIDEDSANPNGYCLHASCYNSKHEAVEAAKLQVLKKISQRQDQTPEAIRKITPEWLKETSVVGFVKRQLEKASENGKETPVTKPKVVSTGRTLTEHELALQQYATQFDAWEKKAYKAILKAINADPLYRVCWCVLLGVPGFWEHPRMALPHIHLYGEPTTKEPLLPPLSKEVEQAVVLAFKGTRNSWVDLLRDYVQSDPDSRSILGIPHPRVLELLAEAMKVTLSAMPEWKPVTASPESAPEKPEAVAV